MRTYPVILVALAGAAFPAARAQCRPGANSNEAKLLAFYSAPITFSALDAPKRSSAWHLELQAEVSPVPTADPSIEHASECYTASAQQHSRLTSVFARPRVILTLPLGLAIEGELHPADPGGRCAPAPGKRSDFRNGPARRIRALRLERPHAPRARHLRARERSNHMRGIVAAAERSRGRVLRRSAVERHVQAEHVRARRRVYGVTSRGGRFDFFAGTGVTWLRPRFEVGFTNLDGIFDNTQVEVNLQRWSLLGGATLHLAGAFAITTEVYSVPKDVTTWRLAASYRLH